MDFLITLLAVATLFAAPPVWGEERLLARGGNLQFSQGSFHVEPASNEELTPIAMACGRTKKVSPIGTLSVEGTHAPANSPSGMSVSECCSQAQINCANRLVQEADRKTPKASCTGCTCPFCGATSCLPIRNGDTSIILESIEFGTCTAYGPVGNVTDCRGNCSIEKPSTIETEIGCTKCQRGHRPNGTAPDGAETGRLFEACPEAAQSEN